MLTQRQQCAVPGCTSKPAERGSGGLCAAHAAAQARDELASAYREMATRLYEMADAAEGRPESVWPDTPGPRELRQLADDCEILSRRRRPDLPERRYRREVTVAEVWRDRWMDPVVEEALLEVWPGRPTPHTDLTRSEWAALMEVMGALTPTERQALYLVRGLGCTHRQAAEQMGVAPGNVYTLLRRARQKVRRVTARRTEEVVG